jgi:hypothetical protein
VPLTEAAKEDAASDEVAEVAGFRKQSRLARWWNDGSSFLLVRFLVLRLLGLVYFVAFVSALRQAPALVGDHGLLPARLWLGDNARATGSSFGAFVKLPSIFWLSTSDAMIIGVCAVGAALAFAVMLGVTNAGVMLVLWTIQLSLHSIGQVFWGYGWELQLLETGMLGALLCPLSTWRPFVSAPPTSTIWLLRWLIVRVMLGAGLIKLRGDPCWRDLTCLDVHFETQPIPNPLTPFFHRLPGGAHKVGVAFNHLVELVVPFFVFGTRRMRILAGGLMVSLQVILILSGNLSFLNWLTLVPIAACFDDGLWRRALPARLVARSDGARAAAKPSRAQVFTVAVVGLAIVALSVSPVLNLLSGAQIMNTSFTRLPLVNSYGAFGSVGRERAQLVVEGTTDEAITPETRWLPYQFKCQPGDPARRPCWMSPYHYRLDWLLWFAAMGSPRDYPWAVHLVAKLLEADPATLSLLASDPFHGTAPRHVRVDLYRYSFAPRAAQVWWERTRIGPWLPPLARDDQELQDFLRAEGWLAAP